MFTKPTLQSTWIPLGLTCLSLLVLNLGLYTRLASQPPADPAGGLPYAATYDSITSIARYVPFGGDWDIRDEALVQLSTTGLDLGTLIPLNIAPEQPYRMGASLRWLGGTMGGGILFNNQNGTTRQQSHVVRYKVIDGRLWIVYGYFGDDSDFVPQGSVALDIAPEDSTSRRLAVQVSGERYRVLLDGEPIASGMPLMYRGGAVGLITSDSQVAFDDLRVDVLDDGIQIAAESTDQSPAPVNAVTPQATDSLAAAPPAADSEAALAAQTAAAPGEVLYSDSFEGEPGGESPWTIISGDWKFIDGDLVQTLTDGYDYSVGYRQPLTTPYTLRVALRHLSGSGGGVLFNLSSPDSKNGAAMVRYFETGEMLIWGTYDAQGVFVGQGNIAVPAPGDGVHTFEIIVREGSYDVLLDGATVIGNVELLTDAAPRYVGLTTSLASAAFEQVDLLTPRADTPTPDTAPSIDMDTAVGTWVVEENAIVQTQTEAFDYIASTGLAAETFIVSVDLTLPADLPDAGAGLVFNMPGRSTRSGGTLVRLANGGREIFWGVYDDAGVFQGRGGAPLTLTDSAPHTLTLVVRADTFDVVVDGTLIAGELPVEGERGWLSLVSFRGPVGFSNFQLTFGEG